MWLTLCYYKWILLQDTVSQNSSFIKYIECFSSNRTHINKWKPYQVLKKINLMDVAILDYIGQYSCGFLNHCCSVIQPCLTLCDPMDWLLHQWSHPAISSSDSLFFCPWSFPASGAFPMSCLFESDDQKHWSFSFGISPSSEYSGLISLKIDSFDLLDVQGTFRSLLQHHSSKTSILCCSAFFMVQFSQQFVTTGKTSRKRYIMQNLPSLPLLGVQLSSISLLLGSQCSKLKGENKIFEDVKDSSKNMLVASILMGWCTKFYFSL